MNFRFFLVSLVLILAPLIRGGNRPLALLILEVLALALILEILLKPQLVKQVSGHVILFLLFLLLLPLFYLIPIPFQFWVDLPGHRFYADALTMGADSIKQSSIPISLDASSTWYSWLALLPPVAIFLAMLSFTREHCKLFVLLFILMAALEAVLGLVQYAQGPSSVLRFGLFNGHSAIGTYSNRDHLAGMLEMALPVSIAFMLSGLHLKLDSRLQSSRNRFLAIKPHTLIKGLLVVLISLGLIFTQSRTGFALLLVLTLLTMVIFSILLVRSTTKSAMTIALTLVFGCALYIGLVPVLDRFTVDPMTDGRWPIFHSTWQAIQEFFPIGSGVGTYDSVFPRFQSPEIATVIISHAHNDYLEWLMEAGVFAALLLLWFLIAYISRWISVLRLDNLQKNDLIQAGAGLAIFAMIIHSFVDFNLHIPANQIYFALIASVFFKRDFKN